MNLRQSTESGEVSHVKKDAFEDAPPLCLLQLLGTTHYYPLLSQGAPGEGDKETFLAAATVLNESFYQVSGPIRAIGHSSNGGIAGSAMVQFDPSDDYALTRKGEWRVNGSTASSPRPFFIHANFPKFNPATILRSNMSTLLSRTMAPPLHAHGRFQKIPSRPLAPISKRTSGKRLCGLRSAETKFQDWKGKKHLP